MADLGTLLADGNGTSPRAWNTQAFGDVDEGISAADGTEIAAATGNGNRNTSLDTSFTFDDTPADLNNVDTLSYDIRYRADNATGDDTLTLGIRVVNGATILAAGSSGGAFETVLSATNTSWHTSLQNKGSTAFTYVNTGATKSDWDGAQVELRSTHSASMGPDDNFCVVDTFELTGTYTVAADPMRPWGVIPNIILPLSQFTEFSHLLPHTFFLWVADPQHGATNLYPPQGPGDQNESVAYSIERHGAALDWDVGSTTTQDSWGNQNIDFNDTGMCFHVEVIYISEQPSTTSNLYRWQTRQGLNDQFEGEFTWTPSQVNLQDNHHVGTSQLLTVSDVPIQEWLLKVGWYNADTGNNEMHVYDASGAEIGSATATNNTGSFRDSTNDLTMSGWSSMAYRNSMLWIMNVIPDDATINKIVHDPFGVVRHNMLFEIMRLTSQAAPATRRVFVIS